MASPSPLDRREARAWRSFQELRVALVAQITRDLARDSGLSEADYAVLVHVSEADGERLRARELGRALQWDRSRLSHQISRMEARGTVRRIPCEGDARGFDVALTPEGREAIASAAPAHLASVRHCFADVLSPAQLDALTDIADTVLAHLAAEHPSAS